MVKRSILLALLALAACTKFEDAALVVDLRVLGMTAEPPEIVTAIDPAAPGAISPAELGTTEVCALVADPGERRRLRYQLTACPPSSDARCRTSEPSVVLGAGVIEDPEEAATPVRLCGTLAGSASLVAILARSVREDDLLGFGNVSVALELAVYPDGESLDQAEWAVKKMRYAPALPPERVANRNPTLDGLTATRLDADGNPGEVLPVPLGRCRDVTPLTATPKEKLRFDPLEPAGAREAYVVPTFSGGERHFTENLAYQWFATDGKWSRKESGGPHELSGMAPPLDSRWTAPSAADTGAGLDVEMWIVQRDERGGQAWYQTCVHVAP